jgi:hypothetical protein
MRYAVTPTLSVEAVHDRPIWLLETAVAVSPLGAVGEALGAELVGPGPHAGAPRTAAMAYARSRAESSGRATDQNFSI